MRKQFLFLGIGGMGMAPLASYMRQRGDIIYGFDDAFPSDLEQFFEMQKIIICEQFPEKIDCVIFSSAIGECHPWMQMAEKEGIPTLRRGHFLAKFCKQKKVIAVTGSHGKTTTTGMLIDHLSHCDYILGGFFQDKNKLPAFYAKENKYLICEVDESDRTIESFHPHITATLNLEDDHVDAYGESKNLDAAFEKLFSKTRQAVVIPENSERLRNITQNLKTPLFFADDLFPEKKNASPVENGMIVRKVLEILEKESDAPTISREIFYSPIFRRHQFLGVINTENQSIEAWADYAHHPTEITHHIENFQSTHPDQKILLIFQPHRYSRTRQYAREFAKAFEGREVLFLPTYGAGEAFLSDGTTRSILRHLPQTTKAKYIESLKDFNLQEFLRNDSFQLILFIGAGDIYQRAKDWLSAQQIFYVKENLKVQDITFQENFSLKRRNSFQIDGTASLWIEPESEEELKVLFQLLQIFEIPCFVIGHGSNLLLDKFGGIFISLKKMPPIFEVDRSLITVSSELSLATFSRRIATLGFQGCEGLASIPGSLGGALCMNAGAHQQSIFDQLVSIKFFDDSSGKIKIISKEQIDFGYRHGCQKGAILSAQFSFTRTESPQFLLEKIKAKAQWRRETQPAQPNAGSIFKNPENHFAGALIEQAGLKEITFGGAKVSEKHANFIINHEQKATADDIKRLLRLVRQKVFEMHGIFLEREILFASDRL
ncbi:MAG: UDP-N-acetylmuramate dehydrogenase [Puniceicoccales bacterium]|jgi:UDP-N-acetylenolpyruvoylglucosamine reductase|nr:UDP-N-acetylmuramate dehydrogenase [Puniceicoccales bacterium]